MKANVWEYSGLKVGEEMDEQADKIKDKVEKRLQLFGKRKDLATEKDIDTMMNDEVFKGASGAYAPLGSARP